MQPSSAAQTAQITGGTESSFPSPDAPGSNDGGYNILFILTDQEQYMGSDLARARCPATSVCAAAARSSRTTTSRPTCARPRAP